MQLVHTYAASSYCSGMSVKGQDSVVVEQIPLSLELSLIHILTRVCDIAEVQQKTTNASKNKTFVFISIELVIFNELISIRFVM